MTKPGLSIRERLLEKRVIDEVTGCWELQGTRNAGG